LKPITYNLSSEKTGFKIRLSNATCSATSRRQSLTASQPGGAAGFSFTLEAAASGRNRRSSQASDTVGAGAIEQQAEMNLVID
jgi:hypothetical protein